MTIGKEKRFPKNDNNEYVTLSIKSTKRKRLTSAFLRYMSDLLDRRNAVFIIIFFRRNKAPGIAEFVADAGDRVWARRIEA